MKAGEMPAVPRAFGGALAAFADRVTFTVGDATPRSGPSSWRDALQRFHAAVGGPWRPACSLWGQIYVTTLLIPAACLLADDVPPRHRLAGLDTTLCPTTGEARGFVLRQGRACGPDGFGMDLLRLIDAELRTVVDRLHDAGGLSRRMLWESAALAWTWAEDEIARADAAASARLARQADGLPFAVRGLPAGSSGSRPAPTLRRACCLRLFVPGHQACPGICPRPDRDLR